MALSLGNPNLPGNPEYVRRAGRILLYCLLPYYALAIGDGFFLPQLVHHPALYYAYFITLYILTPSALLFYFNRQFQVLPEAYLFAGQRIIYRGWELAAITFWWTFILCIVFPLGEPLLTFALALVLKPLHWALSLWVGLPEFSLEFDSVFGHISALPDNFLLRIIVTVIISFAAGLFEEIFFRGLLRQVIAALFGASAVKTYIIGSAMIFGLAHWEQGSTGLFDATAFGLCAAYLYLKLGDLRPLILAHALIDLYIFW